MKRALQFDSITLLSVVSAAAIVCWTARLGWANAVIVLLIAMPTATMLLALTLPRKGNQLDPSAAWYLSLFFRTWLLAIGVVFILGLFAVASPQMADRVNRFLKGDTRVHQVWIRIHATESVSKQIDGKSMQLFYEDGRLIGEIQDASAWGLADGTAIRNAILVSTDHDDFPPNVISSVFDVELKPNGQLVLVVPE